MKSESQTPSGLTRRSFIKKSVVASVAVSSVTIFSGLVNAAGTHPSNIPMYSCELNLTWLGSGDILGDPNQPPVSGVGKFSGYCHPEAKVINGQVTWEYWCRMVCTDPATGVTTQGTAWCGSTANHQLVDPYDPSFEPGFCIPDA